MSDIDKLRREFDRKKRATEFIEGSPLAIADALIAALGDEIAELTGQNIDLEVWRASAVKRAEQAEAERDAAVRIFAAKVREAITGERDRLIYEERWTAADTRCLTFAVEALDALTPKEDS